MPTRTNLHRTLLLWLCLGVLVVMSSFACRRATPITERTPHQLESELAALSLDEPDVSQHAKAELSDEEATTPTPAPLPATPAPAPARKRVMPKTETDAPPAPPKMETLPSEPPPEPLPAPRVAQQEQPQQPWWPRPEEPARKHDTAFDVAVAVGALGVGMGAVAVGAGDGRPGETTFAVVSLGIGVAGFATALVFHAMEAPPQKGARVSFSPVGVSGSF